MKEIRDPGTCINCGRGIARVLHSDMRTCRTDGTRYIYTNKPDDGWCIFRCKCGAVIDENFKPYQR